MLTLLASLGIGGGVVGLLLRLFAPGLISKGLGLLDRIPSWLLYTLLGLVALTGAYIVIKHELKQAYDRGYTAGEVATTKVWNDSFNDMQYAATIWRTIAETQSAKLSDARRKIHDQNLRRNAADADDLRLRGSGKAAPRCGPFDHTGLASAPGGQGSSGPRPDDPTGPLPAGDRFAIVPWSWLVERAKDHDDLRDEVITWRLWDDEQKAHHNKAVADLRARLDTLKVLPAN